MDNKTIQLEIIWDSLVSKYGYQLSKIKYAKDQYKTINFNVELKEAYFYDKGQGIGTQTLLFLMKDVVKFYTVDYNTYYNMWAQRSDDKIYVLGDIINKLYLDN